MQYSHKLFIILCLSGTAIAMPAMGQEDEVPAVAQAFFDNLERQTTAEPDYESVEEDDDGNVTIKNLTIKKPAQGMDPSIDVKIAETVPGYEITQTWGIVVPTGTPAEIVRRLSDEIVKAMHLPDVKERVLKTGAIPAGDQPAEFQAFMADERRRLGEVITKSGIVLTE